MVFYKDHHRMITPDSNNFQRQYNIDPMSHNLFWHQERQYKNYERMAKTVDRSMKKSLPAYDSL